MIRFKVLGPMLVQRDTSSIVLNARMLRRLLAVLLVNANHPATVDSLVAALWGESAPPGHRKTLQVYMHRLRDALGEPDRILQEPRGYRLTVAADELDATQFEILVETGRELLKSGETVEAADSFERALRLWRGPAYTDLNDRPPVAEEAHRLDEERLRVASEHIETRMRLGHHEDLIPELMGLVAQNPYREDLRGHLMLALYRAGRQAEALDLFHKTRGLLRDDLGLEPGPGLRRLQESILRSAPELEMVTAEAMPTVIPRTLPSSPAGFTGRAAQLAALDRIREKSHATSVAVALITGTGGVGKTALALNWSHQSAWHFPDGQLFIDLRGYAPAGRLRPIEALTALLRSLGVPPLRIPLEPNEAAALFRSEVAGKRLLIVLDNARFVDDVRMLLPGTPGCLVLVTSRDRLAGLVAHEGASRVPLDVLTSADAVALITALYPEATTAPETVAELGDACAHLPLAIRIAVAHLLDRPDLTARDLVVRLRSGRRLGALAVPGDDTMAVHKTFELSYRSVPTDARLIFRRLGLVPCRDFTAESAAALADICQDRASELLELLTDSHLINRVKEGRYALHDLLREFAAECGESEDADPVRIAAVRRFYDLCMARLDAAGQLLYSGVVQLPMPMRTVAADFAGEQDALAWLDEEHLNLVAFGRNPGPAGGLDVSWGLADRLRGYFDLRRHMVDWFAASRAGLLAARKAGDIQAQAAMFLSLGHAHGGAGRWEQSMRNVSRAVELARGCGWTEGFATSLGNVGVLHGFRGESLLAAQQFRRSLKIWRSLGKPQFDVKLLNNLATIHWHMGDLDVARRYGQEAVETKTETGVSYFPALTTLSHVLCLAGDYAKGSDGLLQAASIHNTAGNRPFEAFSRVFLGDALSHLGRFDEALESVTQGLRIARMINLYTSIVDGLTTLSHYWHLVGDDEAAQRLAWEAVETARQARIRFELTGAQIALARSHVVTGNLAAAKELARRCMKDSAEARFRIRHEQALLVFAAVCHRLGDGKRARALAARGLRIAQKTGHRIGEAEAHCLLAALSTDRETAGEHEGAAARIFRETGARAPRGLVVSDSGA